MNGPVRDSVLQLEPHSALVAAFRGQLGSLGRGPVVKEVGQYPLSLDQQTSVNVPWVK